MPDASQLFAFLKGLAEEEPHRYGHMPRQVGAVGSLHVRRSQRR